MAESPSLGRLTALSLPVWSLSPAGAGALAASPLLGRLTSLAAPFRRAAGWPRRSPTERSTFGGTPG